jgi:thiol-disulfide isomerase/thioredoxin
VETNRSLVTRLLSLSAYVALAIVIAYWVVDRYPTLLPVGTMAPVDEKFQTVSGSKISFRKKLANKPVLINFWASFCPPCLEELPILSELAQKYADQISWLGIAVARDKDAVIAIKQKYRLEYALGFADDLVLEKWGARVLPTTYLLDADGKVLWVHAGMASKTILENAILSAVNR